MKKYSKHLILASMSSMALLTAFTACSSDDATENQITPTGEKAKTSFVVSLPLRSGTRMAATTVQNLGTLDQFRGMDFMTLIPFNRNGAVQTSDTRIGSNINLPVTASASNYMADNALTNTGCIKYDNVTIPVGTYSFLFYGKAKDANYNVAITTDADKHTYGILQAVGLTESTPASIGFNLVKIYPEVTANAVRDALASYVSAIAAAKVGDDTGQHWYDTDNDALLGLYNEFVTLSLGSSDGVKKAVQDLYSLIYSNSDPLAVAICDAIKTKATPSAGVLTFNSLLGEGETAYPKSIHLPEGAAALSWSDGTPKVATANTTAESNNMGFVIPRVTDYVYPPSLYYRANSTLQTAETSQSASYAADKSWATILAGYTDGTVVKTTTKSVAIKDPIQYAVGRLEATVQLGAATLYDHNGDAVTPPVAGFPVSAILIGGQRNVDFQFVPKSAADPCVIYDNVLTSINATSGAASAAMHTLALETASGTKVNVAIELTNNTGQDFRGHNGDIIKKDAKFYLTAELDPTNGSTLTGNTPAVNSRVFLQDYVTKADFTIKAGSAGVTNNTGLGNAYGVIPDLTSPTMELGMSVDLTWQEGITFTLDM
jgi:hypothetical protein